MKRNVIKKLGIVIMSAIIAASPVVTPFTTMTVYAEEESVPSEEESVFTEEESEYAEEESVFTEDKGTIAAGESYDKNTASDIENYGTIKNNSGVVDCNWSRGLVENNESIVDGNYGKVENNLDGATINENYGTVGYNKSGGTIKSSSFVISKNEGNIKDNSGQVVDNNLGGCIDINNNIVINNSGTITENYGSVNNNTGTIINNYSLTDGYSGVVENNNGTIQNQWYEVVLENNTTEVKIKGNSIQDIGDSGNIDVFAKKGTEITIYSIDPTKIIDAIDGDIEYVKNSDGTITIRNIKNPYSLLITLVNKIVESAPTNNVSDNKEEVVIEISSPVAPTQAQIATPAGAVNKATVVAANPVAAIQAAKTLQNDPVVVAQAKELAVHMEAETAAHKEAAVKELEAVPNQAIVGSTEYEAKQTAVVAELTSQVESINKLTVQSLAVLQNVGVSVATGGCTKLEAANISLLNEILAKGVPVTITYALNGKPVTIKIPADVNLTRYIGADGRLDLTKLNAYIVR